MSRKLKASFILSLWIIQLLILVFLPQYEALATKTDIKDSRGRNNKKTKMSMKMLQEITQSTRTYNGQQTSVPSLLMLMESSPYYLWEHYSTGLILSDTCVLLRAYDLANTWNDPPTLYTDYYHTLYIPRYGCDVNHHIRDVYFNTPPYDWRTEENDISLATTKQRIKFGNNVCGTQPVAPTWVSCDPVGPPVGYTDCYWASYGLTNYTDNYYVASAEEINPNADQIQILSKEKCDEIRDETGDYISMNPDNEICASTVKGENPYCPHDRNGALFCKYWGNVSNSPGWNAPPQSGWNSQPPSGWNPLPPTGWNSPDLPDVGWPSPSGWSGTSPPSSGWLGSSPPPSGWPAPSGWNSPVANPGGWPAMGWREKEHSSKNKGDKRDDSGGYVAVGHVTWFYGDYCPDDTAAIFLKYGSKSYWELFSQKDCEFTCSSELPPGYRCQGNPDPSLGPVYCKAEPIPTYPGWSKH